MPLRVVYAGTPEFAVPALVALAAAGHSIAAVLTQPDRPSGRGRALNQSAVKRRALELGLEVRQPPTLKDGATVEALAALEPDLIVVAAYGLLLPPAVLGIPRAGCLNIHGSLLPRWRGAAPVQRAILEGDADTGVALMRMEQGLDTGPVYATRRLAIGPRDTAASLTQALATLGAALLVESLEAIAAGTLAPVPQGTEGVRYASKLDKSAAPLDWRRPAAELDRQVRAFVPWPVASTGWRGTTLRVHEARERDGEAAAPPGTVLAIEPTGIDVATGRGRLSLLAVQRPGKAIVGAAEFARAVAADGFTVGARLDGSP